MHACVTLRVYVYVCVCVCTHMHVYMLCMHGHNVTNISIILLHSNKRVG